MSYRSCKPTATAVIQESAAGVSASRSSDEVQAAYSALLEQALSHLQLLGVESASAKHSKKKAQERLYALLEALAKVSTSFISLLQNCLLPFAFIALIRFSNTCYTHDIVFVWCLLVCCVHTCHAVVCGLLSDSQTSVISTACSDGG